MGDPSSSWWNTFKGAYRGHNPTSVLKTTFLGGVSAVAPIEPMPWLMKSADDITKREGEISRLRRDPGLANRTSGFGRFKGVNKLSMWEKATTKGTRTITRGAGKLAARWLGPVFGAYRLGTEVDIRQQGVGGAISKTGRIAGEEILSTAAFVGGMALGGKIGAGIGATLGTAVAPGVGTAAGFVIGAGIGMAGSMASTWAWNKTMDVAEAPIRLAHAGWKYFENKGRRGNRPELGGRVSRGNSSQMAYTMRSRALQQMNRSGINARSLLGNEAQYMHIR